MNADRINPMGSAKAVIALVVLLMLAIGAEGQPFDSAETLQPIPDSTISATGSIASADDWTAYVFTAPAAGSYRIRMIAESGTLDPTLELYDEQGRLLRTNDNAGGGTFDSELRVALSMGRQRYFVAAGENGTVGDYKVTISIEPRDDLGNTITEARQVRLVRGSARPTGVLNYDGDADVFCVIAPNAAPMNLSLEAAGNGGAFGGSFRLCDSNGNEVLAGSSQSAIDVDKDETFYVEVSGQSNSQDRYRLNIYVPVDKVGNNSTEASAIRLRRRGKGRERSGIAFEWDVDFYSVEAVTSLPMLVDLRAAGPRGNGFAGRVTVYDSSNSPIASADDLQGDGAHLSVDPVEGETYYIAVEGYSGSTGDYILEVQCTIDDHGDTMNEASRMRWDDGVFGRRGCLDYAGDVDVFTLVATRSGYLRVWARSFGRDNTVQPSFTVCDNLGDQLAQGTAGADEHKASASCEVSEGQAYFITVSDSGDDGMGRYAVRARIRRQPGPDDDDDDDDDDDPGPGPGPDPGDLPVWVESVDNSSALGNYVTQDVFIETETDWLSAQMVVQLTSGAIYQDPAGSDFSPNPALFTSFPSLEFDSYVGNGILGVVVATLPASDLNPGAAKQFDTSGISIGWFTMGTEIGQLALARVTLSQSASGTWEFRATASPASTGPFGHVTGTIEDGVMIPD